MIDITKVSFNFIKKEPFIGSDSGMRYRLAKASNDDGDYMDACIWPEPYCYEKTDDSLKTRESFPLTADGCAEAVSWLNEQLEVRAELWDSVNGKPLLTIM